jgi:hypothetical protein
MLQPYTHSDKTVTIKAIETRYAGCRFRSRLEARWAVLLDRLGVRWMYEHQGYETEHGPYLPDFWLPQLNTFLEIKPEKPTREEWGKLHSVIDASKAFGAFGVSLKPGQGVLPSLPREGSPDRLYPWPDELPRSTEACTYTLSELASDEYGDFVCPVCGSNYVHSGAPVVLTEDYPHKHVHSRGPITCIPMSSELCWHEWELVVAFHKGDTSVSVCVPFDGNFSPLELLLAQPAGQLAVEAALSARFEHGETP